MGERLHILEKINNDLQLQELWNGLTLETKKKIREIDEGIRVPDFLCDTIFKGIFNPDIHRERLSRFISSILGKKVKVLHSLGNEGFRQSIHSKGIILDIVVQFEDGSIGNVEIQRMGIQFPSKRAVVYSADLVSKQYATLLGELKSDVNYEDIKPVYTIIIMEKSAGEFKESTEYIHHFKQESDTGVEVELVQYYDYVCLDKFKEKNPRVASELEKWLTFLTIQSVRDMKSFLSENPEFQSVYNSAIIMTKDRKELLNMLSEYLENEDIVASLNKTNESIIKRLEREKAELEVEATGLKDENAGLKDENAELLDSNIEKDKELVKKETEIKRLKRLLQESQK